jgi:predicted DNA-binding transcriptional regulator AlpA
MMTNIPHDDPLLTTPEAAKYTKISAPTLARWRYAGLGPDWSKLGAGVRYRKSALDLFVEISTHHVRRPKARRALEVSGTEAI